MNETIETPYKGLKLRASWAAAVAARLNSPGVTGASRALMRDGSGIGFEPLPENLRARIRHRPFEVAGSGGDDYKFAIYVPANVVAIGEEIVTPDGITAIPDTDGWYKLDDESDVSEDGSTLYLVAYDDGSATFTFDLEEAAGESEDDPKILAILPIAELKTQSVGQKTFGVVYRQLACHPFAVSLGGGDTVAHDGMLSIQSWDDPRDKQEIPEYHGTFSANQATNTTIKLHKVHDAKLKLKIGDGSAVDKFSANAKEDSTIELAKVAGTGSYDDLKNKPSIPDAPSGYTGDRKSYDSFSYDTSSGEIRLHYVTKRYENGLLKQILSDSAHSGNDIINTTPHS